MIKQFKKLIDNNNYKEINKMFLKTFIVSQRVLMLNYRFNFDENDFSRTGILYQKDEIYLVCPKLENISLGDKICVYNDKINKFGWINCYNTPPLRDKQKIDKNDKIMEQESLIPCSYMYASIRPFILIGCETTATDSYLIVDKMAMVQKVGVINRKQTFYKVIASMIQQRVCALQTIFLGFRICYW